MMNGHDPHPSYRQRRPETAQAVSHSFMRDVRKVTSQALFLGEHEIGIEHAGSLYRLKITRQNKLILNK